MFFRWWRCFWWKVLRSGQSCFFSSLIANGAVPIKKPAQILDQGQWQGYSGYLSISFIFQFLCQTIHQLNEWKKNNVPLVTHTHNHAAELEPKTACDYSRAIWPWNDCWLYLFLLKDKSQMLAVVHWSCVQCERSISDPIYSTHTRLCSKDLVSALTLWKENT